MFAVQLDCSEANAHNDWDNKSRAKIDLVNLLLLFHTSREDAG
ncbi:hypothetical protein BN2497_12015 [Janthinobacterium sp. CG23_2]|nr:hypothetical protein BN2497_12015 [Janthinobacterium sp. CG23_2]CUU32405.1 hypothetical protein BN3177_12015 [Janthinobacterium sp. CG23_2]